MPRSDHSSTGTTDVLVASAARTASGNSGPQTHFGAASRIRAQLDVTAASGVAPTLDVFIEDTLDGTNWNPVGTFTQRTAAGRQVVDITGLFSDVVRVRWAIAGTTPNFTFSVITYSEK